MHHDEVAADEAAADPRVRRAVHWFLLVFAITGVAHLELWPFTGFRMFSELQPEEREDWAIVAVDPAGVEHEVRFGELPIAYRNTARLAADFDGRAPAEREAICDAWAEAVRDEGGDVDHLRIYSVVGSVRPDGPPPTRTATYECGSDP